MNEETKLLRIESICDNFLARLIALPSPLTFLSIVCLLSAFFIAGFKLGEWL